MKLIEIFNSLGFAVLGGGLVFWLIYSNYNITPKKENDDLDEEEPEEGEDFEEVDSDFDSEDADDYNPVYVQVPDRPRPIEINIEQPLALHHIVSIGNKVYVVTEVLHKADGHTLFVLDHHNAKYNASQKN